MKKNIAITILMVTLVAGQALSQKGFYFGVAATGLNTWLTNQNNYGLPEMDYKLTFGFSGNVNLGFDFSKNFGIKTEIGYAMLGQDYKDEVNDTTVTRKVNLNYLQVPLLFKYSTGSDLVRFYLLVGPQFNFLLSADQEYLKNSISTEEEVYNPFLKKPVKIGEETITDRYNDLDIFARIDFGIDISVIDNLIINAGISMGYGLTDINADDWKMDDVDGNYNPAHNIYGGFNVGICYKIPVGKKESK